MLGCFVYVVVPYQESAMLQLCRIAAAVGNNTIYVRSQMTGQQTTCGEHNATTLSHSSSGRQHHLCARAVSSLCCGELLVSEPVICHFKTCGEQNATGRTMCACRILSIRRRVAFVVGCHVYSSCFLVLNTCFLHYSTVIASHATRVPSRSLAVLKLQFQV